MPQTITLVNLIPSPLSSNSGWPGSAISSVHAKYGSQCRRLNGTTSSVEVLTNTSAGIQLINTHKYYARVETYQETKVGTTDIYWPIAEPSFLNGKSGPAGQWNIVSAVNTRSSFSNGSYQLRLDFNNSYSSGSMWFDGAMLIDLTSCFGQGNEPTKEWLDANIPWFSGTYIYEYPLNPPTNLNCEVLSGSAHLTWSKPDPIDRPITDIDGWNVDTWSTPSTNRSMLTTLAHYNGTYLCGGYAGLYISTNPSNGWTILSSDTTGITDEIKTLACYDGIWVALANGTYNTYSTKIYTTRNPNGKWTKNSYELPFLSHQNALRSKVDIAYNDGVWVAVGITQYGDQTMYFTGNPDGIWNSFDPSYTGIPNNSIITIGCHDGTWAAIDASYQVWYTNTNGGHIALNKWQSGEYLTPLDPFISYPKFIKFCEGMWFVGFSLTNNTSGDNSCFMIANDLAGSWEMQVTGASVEGITYYNGYSLVAEERAGLEYYGGSSQGFIDLDSTLPTDRNYNAIVKQVENFNGCVIAIGSKSYYFNTVTWEQPAIWTFNSSGDADVTGYKVYQNGVLIGSTPGNDTTFDQKINPRTNYKFSVTAYNTKGESDQASINVYYESYLEIKSISLVPNPVFTGSPLTVTAAVNEIINSTIT